MSVCDDTQIFIFMLATTTTTKNFTMPISCTQRVDTQANKAKLMIYALYIYIYREREI